MPSHSAGEYIALADRAADVILPVAILGEWQNVLNWDEDFEDFCWSSDGSPIAHAIFSAQMTAETMASRTAIVRAFLENFAMCKHGAVNCPKHGGSLAGGYPARACDKNPFRCRRCDGLAHDGFDGAGANGGTQAAPRRCVNCKGTGIDIDAMLVAAGDTHQKGQPS